MPIGVFVLAVAVFAQGTSEFMMSGLVARTAADFGVSLGTVGLLTSLYAVGMVLGAPTMAATAGRRPLRRSATTFLALFCLAHVVGAVTAEFGVLVATRVIAAVANAGFLAVVLAALPRLVGAAQIGRATSVIVSGVTVACVAGVPAGTVLGQLWGWRSAFWAVAVVGAGVLVAMVLTLPLDDRDRSTVSIPSVRSEWAVLGVRRVRAAVVVGILVNAATFAGFTYLGTITAQLAGQDSGWVPVVLAVFGIGSFAGVTLAGRHSDRHGERIIGVGTVGLVGVWVLAALTAQSIAAVAIMTFVVGAVAFGVGSTLIATIVRSATPVAPRSAGALATTALNIGAVLGPVTAGVIVDRVGDPVAALWCGAASATVAAAIVLVGRRGRHPAPDDVGVDVR
ncbi:Cmx/CmrA family chloramphenicol efflux MFS transporter [Nocardia salmonicida]|uniref:Cmx/CmrA family chloramphenicol efflux MFS transporter n=1 Tax=Nocardia salmonicida TaxID=53431 RepID=UPI002E27FD7B|nr:Cmx/CmrA family chloramphenicol efflux MFS transporter [Nocardia salmonicida]